MKRSTLFLPLACLLAACSGQTKLTNAPPRNERIACFGDSLVYGTGAGGDEQAYPAQLASILGREVVNLGTPGDTTGQGLARLDLIENGQYGIVVVTLGGNDILQRVHWDTTAQNLRDIFTGLQRTGAVVVFTGVTGPLNPTRDKHYARLCREHGVFYISEILEGIRQDDSLKSDEIHPNAAGYRLMAERIAAALREAGLVD